jgi:pimeloyl-ACP methyl ester carboxylesterase
MGFSYGTFLGQTYANMFPRRVRAMLLDGVVDSVSWTRGAEARAANTVAPTDGVFDRFQSLCQRAGPERCALAGQGPVGERVRRLFRGLRHEAIPAPSADPPGELTYADLLLALFAPIRDPAQWPRLAEDLDAAANGDGSALETSARPARSPSAWAGVTTSAAIQCADGPARRGSRAWPKVIGRLTEISYLQGRLHGWWEWAPCASWPVRAADRYAGPWYASTRNPILLIGTRHDPSTAYANARRPHTASAMRCC